MFRHQQLINSAKQGIGIKPVHGQPTPPTRGLIGHLLISIDRSVRNPNSDTGIEQELAKEHLTPDKFINK